MRLFQCSCRHWMRLGARNCGYCFKRAPLWNRLEGIVLAIALAGGGMWYALV